MDKLRERHQQLDEHFSRNSLDRGNGPACRFLIDHEVDVQELVSIRELVLRGLRSCSLSSFDWQTAYLPLLICAVEVGYGYEGNGTDFWPRLSETLGSEFDTEDRKRISQWFAHASSNYGAVAPGNSQWEKAFRHIAWPITHAVAAKDIRQPFADCLQRFRHDVLSESVKDDTIVNELSQILTPVGSRRFRTWLERPEIVAGIVRDLLGGKQLNEAELFSKHFRDRLIEDLRSEPDIRRAVRQIETNRVRNLKRVSDKSDYENQSHLRFGSFFLCHGEHGCLELCGEMPELSKVVQRALKTVRRRWKVRRWGFPGASPIPGNCLRSNRGHFHVSFSYAARANSGTPFFTEIEEQNVDKEAQRWLESVRFPAAEMLAFPPIQPRDDSSHCISGRAPHSGKIWVLSRQGEIEVKRSKNNGLYCREVGLVDGGEVHEFDADDPEVREWLGWPGTSSITKVAPLCFTWLRPSSVSIESVDCPIYTTDDEVGISVLGEEPLTLVLREGSKEVTRELVTEVATLGIEKKGSYSLTVLRGEQEVDSFSFGILDDSGDGFIESDPEPPWHAMLSHVDAGETELSRSDLFNHHLNLDISGDRGIENISAKLSLSPSEATASISLDRIPTRLATNHPIWNQLIKAVPESVLKSPCDLTLSVEIEGMLKKSWRLETELQELWWEDGENNLPIAVNDSSSFNVQHYCLLENRVIDKPNEGDPFLSVALDSNDNEFHFDARIGLLGDSILFRTLRPPRRFLRQMDDIGDCSGVRSITQRYLQISSASSSSLIAEINRVRAADTLRSWVLHCLCGSNWFYKHQEMRHLESSNPAEIWWMCQSTQKDLLQPPSEKVRHLPEMLPALVLTEFAEVLPEQWWDGTVAEVDGDGAIPLDSMYQHLIEDDSVFVDAESLTRSLCLANEQLCGADLADLIIPVSGGDELLGWRITGMTISDLATELHSWIRRHLGRGRGRQSWIPSELSIYFNMLLYPERLRKQAWETVLEKLLHDRSVARAGAFIAWRVQQNARLEK